MDQDQTYHAELEQAAAVTDLPDFARHLPQHARDMCSRSRPQFIAHLGTGNCDLLGLCRSFQKTQPLCLAPDTQHDCLNPRGSCKSLPFFTQLQSFQPFRIDSLSLIPLFKCGHPKKQSEAWQPNFQSTVPFGIA